MNQVIAYNVGYWRKARALTQEGLGELLELYTGKPWSKATLSALERSWDGKRIRQFDGDLILALSRSLRVPVNAFFLPPDDDGTAVRYITLLGEDVKLNSAKDRFYRSVSAEGLLEALFPRHETTDNPSDMFPYISRVVGCVDFYWGGSEEPWGLAYRYDGDQVVDLTERRHKLQDHRHSLRDLLGYLDREIDHLQKVAIKQQEQAQEPAGGEQ